MVNGSRRLRTNVSVLSLRSRLLMRSRSMIWPPLMMAMFRQRVSASSRKCVVRMIVVVGVVLWGSFVVFVCGRLILCLVVGVLRLWCVGLGSSAGVLMLGCLM